jgi:acetamidase/formamidase
VRLVSSGAVPRAGSDEVRTIHHRHGHFGWDRDQPPALEIGPDEVVELVLADCFDGQLGADATADHVAALDLSRGNPLTGPIHVDGARPGDTLLVEVLDLEVGTVGWTTLLPGFGLLADDFPEPHVVVTTRDGARLEVGGIGRLRAEPFLGTVGVAPAAPGRHDVIPPRRVGGNLDCKLLRRGATLLLPVEVDGALLSIGDAHMAQGDGEVCGTAVETTATARLRITVNDHVPISAPQIQVPADARGGDPSHRQVTTGVGPDLYAAARDATRAMIDHLVRWYDLAPEDAYILCSIAGDLRIAEIVDAPNWVVTMDLPLKVVGGGGQLPGTVSG